MPTRCPIPGALDETHVEALVDDGNLSEVCEFRVEQIGAISKKIYVRRLCGLSRR